MSSLHQDRLLAQGSEPTTGSAPALATGRGTSRRPAGKKATATVPTQRQGMASDSEATSTRTDRSARPAGTRRTAGATSDATKAPAAQVAEPLDSPVDGTGEATAVVADVAARSPLARFLHRRPPSTRRRPALYLAATLVGALSVSAVAPGGAADPATETMGQSVSVAKELGIRATPAEAITDTDAAELLGDLAVSRNARDAEQAAAAQAQAEADRVAAEAAAAAAQAAAEAARPKAVLPVAGARLTSGFGPRWGTLHAGIDLAAPIQTPEYAAMDGVVLEAGPASGFGLAVYIQHQNGDVTVYGHMDSILVQPGQVVRAGDTIALLGNRGQSTGPHLHFEVHVGGMGGEKIDPLPWLRGNGVAI
jgi:murein DD-endopeptidase MepM/ murein hydrolase activator NlpD